MVIGSAGSLNVRRELVMVSISQTGGDVARLTSNDDLGAWVLSQKLQRL